MPKRRGSETPPNEPSPKIAKVTDHCFSALVRAFKGSPKFAGYSDATKDIWGRELDFMARPDLLGGLSTQEIRPSLVQGYFDALTGRPGKQAAARSALRQLEKWAITRELLPRQITLGVEIEDMEGGHVPWTDAHVALAEQRARPDLARAVTLGANTGQRGSDLIRMCPTDIEINHGHAGIAVTQKKTGRQVWVPILGPLAAAIESWERRPGPWLRRPDGDAWLRKDLTLAWKYERDHNPALAPLKEANLHLHGLRGHACVRLVRAGCNTRQIADLVGMSEQMVSRYTKLSAQRENALAAVLHLKRTTSERENDKDEKSAS